MEKVKPSLRYVVIDDFYSVDELAVVCEEIQQLKQFEQTALQIHSANDSRTGTGLHLDEYFLSNRNDCNILKLNRKLFSEETIKKALVVDASYLHLNTCDADSSLLNFYKDGEEYKSHYDKATLSALTFFGFGNFTGGDFYFPQFKETIEFKHNRLVIFPSCVNHQVLPIHSQNGGYRASIAQFITYKDQNEH